MGSSPSHDTIVSESETLNYNCFSPPIGKWVPAMAEMVLVIDLAEWRIFVAQAVSPQGAEMV